MHRPAQALLFAVTDILMGSCRCPILPESLLLCLVDFGQSCMCTWALPGLADHVGGVPAGRHGGAVYPVSVWAPDMSATLGGLTGLFVIAVDRVWAGLCIRAFSLWPLLLVFTLVD